jgi:2'-5' RNA ligase
VRRVEPDHHLTIFLPAEVAAPIEAARREWDPVMADQIAAHVTLVYPREAPDRDLLVQRLRAARRVIAPFRLRLGALACFERPDDGVHVTVDDVDGGYRAVRQRVLTPPFRPVVFEPHVTIVHPRTSRRGRELWDRGLHLRPGQVFAAREAALTAFDGSRWVVAETFTLGRST